MDNDHIRPDTKVPGLQEARRKLAYMKMSKQERQAYDRHLENIMIQNDVIDTAREEGLSQGIEEGRALGIEEGRAEGRAEERITIARKLLANGISIDIIKTTISLTDDEINLLNTLTT